MSERVFTFPTYDLAQSILGQHNRYLQMMNEVIPADIVSRGDTVVIKGDELQVEALYRTLEELVFLYKEGSTITESQVRIAAKMVMNGIESLGLVIASTHGLQEGIAYACLERSLVPLDDGLEVGFR